MAKQEPPFRAASSSTVQHRTVDDRPRVPRLHRWQTLVPLAFVMVALVAIMAVPLIGEWYMRPLRDEMRELLEPARSLVTRIHVALALEGSTLHDYLDSRDPALLERYGAAATQEQAAFRALAPLASNLGPNVREHLDDVQRLQQRWHDLVQLQLQKSVGSPSAADREQLYDDLVTAAAGLDEAMNGALQSSRNRVEAAERMQRVATVVFGVLALLAMILVAWLGRELSLTATENQQRRIELERAIEARGRLVRGVSHDLKNPLNAIDGHAQLLEEGILGPLSAGQHDSVTRIRRAVRSLLGLIGDMLELSRAENGHLRLAMQRVDLRQAVADVIEEHRPAVESSGHELDVEGGHGVPSVVTDPMRVAQILGNLLSNAVKYTPNGGRIGVTTGLLTRDGDGDRKWAAVQVADTGPGIPAGMQETIFEEFTRLDVDAQKPGAGLGLAIARRVARLLGGDLTVASTMDGGSTFTLWLPTDNHAVEVSDERPSLPRQPFVRTEARSV
jgi:signal transduction histidine kinase